MKENLLSFLPTLKKYLLLLLQRAPVAQVVVQPTSKQEVRGSIPEPVPMEIFLSTSTEALVVQNSP